MLYNCLCYNVASQLGSTTFLSRIDEGSEPSSEATLPDDDDDVTIASVMEDSTISPEDLVQESE